MVLPAEEEAFPRGGADLLSPLEKRQLNARAKADAAREAAAEGGAARKRPKKVSCAVAFSRQLGCPSPGRKSPRAERKPPPPPPTTPTLTLS